eukprot:15331646-Alexandrium_andersonii.AAC.1
MHDCPHPGLSVSLRSCPSPAVGPNSGMAQAAGLGLRFAEWEGSELEHEFGGVVVPVHVSVWARRRVLVSVWVQ